MLFLVFSFVWQIIANYVKILSDYFLKKYGGYIMKSKRIKSLFLSVLLVISMALSGCGLESNNTEKTSEKSLQSVTAGDVNGESDTTETPENGDNPEETDKVNGTLEVHYIDVGQGDATLIKCGDSSMLIDAGNNNKGTAVQLYLTKQGVKTLDYVIGTHPDADHIGGLDVIISKFDCNAIIMPDCTSDTATYRDVIDAIKYKSYSVTLPEVGTTYKLGEAEFTILSPSKNYPDKNDNSVSLILKYGDSSFLFTGDCEETAENAMLNCGISIEADVYKAGHHGSRTASSKAFMEAVNPEYAVISCGEGNSYGHPHAEVMNLFRSMDIKVFRTDEQGSIIASTDGENITWNMSPSDTWNTGEAGDTTEKPTETPKETPTETPTEAPTEEVTQAPATVAPSTGQQYVLNTSSMKFHLPTCKYLPTKNRKDVTATRDELIEQGYDPCKRCNP